MSTLFAPSSSPTTNPAVLSRAIVYPESDGKPMAESTRQYRWIVKFTEGLDLLLAGDVFVGADLFWYPVVGNPQIVAAPDVIVAFGRPKGDRASYHQWEEGGIVPQVVFEILSPSNRFAEMTDKFEFYRRHGVEEYYIFNPEPERFELSGYLRRGVDLVAVATMDGHVSPRLKVRFELDENDADGLRIIRPDGKPFITYQELAEREQQAGKRADEANQRAEEANKLAEAANKRAELLQTELERVRQAAAPLPPRST